MRRNEWECTCLVHSTYDGTNNRTGQTDYSAGSLPIVTSYSNDVLGLTQVLAADDGTITTYNVYGLDLISQQAVNGKPARLLLPDGLGSVRQEMVGSSLRTTTSYDPYGNMLAQTGSSGTVYGFTGEQEDSATGLLYLRARYYNPSLMLFMKRDPWGGNTQHPSTLHGYVYGFNNPARFSDPNGLQCNDTSSSWCTSIIGGSTVSNGGTVPRITLNQNNDGYWEVLVYRKDGDGFSGYDEAALLSGSCGGHFGPLGITGTAENVIGAAFPLHDSGDIAMFLLSAWGDTSFVNGDIYHQKNYNGELSLDAGIFGGGIYGENSVQNGHSDANFGVQVNLLSGVAGVSAETANFGDSFSLEFSGGTPEITNIPGLPAACSTTPLTRNIGINYDTDDKKMVVVPSIITSQYVGREDEMAERRFRRIGLGKDGYRYQSRYYRWGPIHASESIHYYMEQVMGVVNDPRFYYPFPEHADNVPLTWTPYSSNSCPILRLVN